MKRKDKIREAEKRAKKSANKFIKFSKENRTLYPGRYASKFMKLYFRSNYDALQYEWLLIKQPTKIKGLNVLNRKRKTTK